MHDKVVDTEKILYSTSDTKLSSSIIQIGDRWKFVAAERCTQRYLWLGLYAFRDLCPEYRISTFKVKVPEHI